MPQRATCYIAFFSHRKRQTTSTYRKWNTHVSSPFKITKQVSELAARVFIAISLVSGLTFTVILKKRCNYRIHSLPDAGLKQHNDNNRKCTSSSNGVYDSRGRGGGVLPYMGHIGMCHCEGYGFQAVYSSIGYINQSVWV